MKVLKFGGTSVGTVESLANVKAIVEALDEPAVVVVSALGGITDKLIATARMAADGQRCDYREQLYYITERHMRVIDGIVRQECRYEVRRRVQALLGELERLYYGIYLVSDLSDRVMDRVVSYGERMSSEIVAGVVQGIKLVDSLGIIHTTKRHGRHVLDQAATAASIERVLAPLRGELVLMGGFISTGSDGCVTNLGRGGSDYTAAVVAAALDADSLEIWTDVDGFLTADPRKIKGTGIIDRMSFVEAMELCNFGAKVVYPPTIYPVFHKNIPIYIKNTFNPSAPGTLIADGRVADGSVRGISSISDTCLHSVGMPGANGEALQARVLNAMARKGIDVFMSCLDAGGCTVTFATRNADAALATEELRLEFGPELAKGDAVLPDPVEQLATIAVVGEGLSNAASLLAHVRRLLDDASVEVLSASVGRSGSNVAVVVRLDCESKAMNLIHADIFGSN